MNEGISTIRYVNSKTAKISKNTWHINTQFMSDLFISSTDEKF